MEFEDKNLKNGGKPKITAIDKIYEWGVYFWQLPDGHLFHDGEGRFCSIQAYKGDFEAIAKLSRLAAANGQPEGKPWFKSGARQVTDEEYSEQEDRLAQGLIPTMNDLGAVMAAKEGLKTNGDY